MISASRTVPSFDATRDHQTRPWLVSFSILGRFGQRHPAQESRPEAIALDGRLARAWVGHNALHVVENGTGSFEEKMRRTVDVVCRSLGAISAF